LGQPSRCVRQLDRFHLARALRTGLGPAAAEASQACIHGQWAELGPLWRRALQAAGGSQHAELVRQQRAYLQRQVESLLDYRHQLPSGPECRSLGAIESNGDQLLKNRLGTRGLRWTVAGAQHLVKVLQEQTHGRLTTWLGLAPRTPAEPRLRQPFSAADVLPQHDAPLVDEDWLAARIPLLAGPGRKGPLFHALKTATAPGSLPVFWDRILDAPTKPAY
jgi:hypothetical protein